MDGDGVTRGEKNSELDGKKRFRNMTIGDKKGEEAERERKKGGGKGDLPLRRGGWWKWSRHGSQFLPEGHFMMSIPVPMFCDRAFDEHKIKIRTFR